MTSASELFYQRRSRVSRADADPGLEPSSSDRGFLQNYSRRHHHNHNHRHDLDGCDPLRRSPHVRHPCHRLSSIPERPSVRFDQGTNQFVPSSNLSTETLSSTSSPRLTGNDRLPGTVLLARARLLERLRGVSLSGNRQSGRASFGIYNREYTFGDELRVVDAGDWGTDIPTALAVGGSPFTDSSFQTQRLHIVQEAHKKKPAGLTPDALDCLQSEVFSSLEKGVEGHVSQVSWDCSICLESFTEGDELIRLPCEHRFHSACLDPWVRTCGDCPYCRRDIIGKNAAEIENPSINKFYDRRTLICESIAKRVFPRESDPEYIDIECAHYAYRVRNRLMKVLVPLRQSLIKTRRRESVPSRPVVSTAVKKMYSGLCTEDCNERFRVYVEIATRTGKKSELLLPHEIVSPLREKSGRKVAGSQWKKLVAHLQKKGSLRNCLAICGVSRDMTKKPKDICVSMALLISELSEDPWKGKIVTCSDDPKLCNIEGCDLQSKIEFLRQSEFHGNVNIQKVFDQVMDFAVAEKIGQDKMPRKIFTFGDFGIQQASAYLWCVWGNYRRKKREGYTKLPEIVFWNLRGDSDSLNFPARHLNGVTMVNGYSNDSSAAMLERDVVPMVEDVVPLVGPDKVMETAISGELFENLLVYK